MKVKVAYLGPVGTYSHQMTQQVYQGTSAELIAYPTMEQVLEVVESSEVDEAIVPIENSTEGAVLVATDVLAHGVNLQITNEYLLPIEHFLWGVDPNQVVREIISHPQALGQCRKFIKATYPEAQLTPFASSAGAVYELLQGHTDLAAIGSRQSGEELSLVILKERIQDQKSNCTRFVQVKKKSPPLPKVGWLKISFVCMINGEKSGSLQEVLQEFSSRKINMTRIESRPTGAKIGEYYFFIDIVDEATSVAWQEALTNIERESLWFKNLGIYPVLQEKAEGCLI